MAATARYYWPDMRIASATANFSVAFTVDAASEQAAFVCQAPYSGDIRYIHWRTGAVTTSNNCDLDIETVDASGDPSGTPKDTGATTLVTMAIGSGAYTANTNQRTQLTNDCTVTMGDLIAVVWKNPASSQPSFEIRGSNLFRSCLYAGTAFAFPYGDNYTGTWAKAAKIGFILAFEYADGAVHITGGCSASTVWTVRTYNSGSATTKYAQRVWVPVNCSIVGASAMLDMDNACDLVLYDASWNVLKTGALSTVRQGTGTGIHEVFFSTPYTATNGYYYVGVVPGASNISLWEMAYFDPNGDGKYLGAMGFPDETCQAYSGTTPPLTAISPVAVIPAGLILDAAAVPAGTGGGGGGGGFNRGMVRGN